MASTETHICTCPLCEAMCGLEIMRSGTGFELLRPGERDEIVEVPSISLNKGAHIALTHRRRVCVTGRTPTERSTAKRFHEIVRGNATVPTVAIRKRMDFHETVVEPNAEFVGVEGFVFDPSERVLDKGSNFGGDQPGVDADVGFSEAISPGPCPNFIEHRSMQGTQVRIVEQFFDRRRSQQERLNNVSLLGVVQFSSGRDVAGK